MKQGLPTITSAWHCPKCGEKLVLKEGRYGKFMACPNYPDCQYTRALWTYQATHEKLYCEKCKGEGKLPLRRKSDNSIIPYAFVYCECHEDEPECYIPYSADMFDFPCSESWRAYFTETYG